jgi:hypothetical protein
MLLASDVWREKNPPLLRRHLVRSLTAIDTEGTIARIDAEWVALSAFRELTRLATKGDMKLSTYNGALDLGGDLYPDLLG